MEEVFQITSSIWNLSGTFNITIFSEESLSIIQKILAGNARRQREFANRKHTQQLPFLRHMLWTLMLKDLCELDVQLEIYASNTGKFVVDHFLTEQHAVEVLKMDLGIENATHLMLLHVLDLVL